MIWFVLLATLAVIAAILLRVRSRRALMGLGIAFAILGAGALAMLEWRYSPSRVEALDAAVSLPDARIAKDTFTVALDGPFDVSLQVDRGDGVLTFGCLTAEPGFEALCLGREPELDMSWTLLEAGVPIARGGGDLAGWLARRAALDPKQAAASLARFRAYADHAQEPSDQTPLYHALGSFRGVAGHTYRLVLVLHRAAPTLARLHPRAIVGLSADVTRGAGTMFLAFSLLCLGGGAFMLLMSFAKARTAP